MKLKPFSGAIDEEEIASWLHRYEVISDTMRWSDSKRTKMLSLSLCGRAEREYGCWRRRKSGERAAVLRQNAATAQSQPKVIIRIPAQPDWQEVRCFLLSTFCNTRNEKENRRSLAVRVQGPNETIASYAFEVLRLTKLVCPLASVEEQEASALQRLRVGSRMMFRNLLQSCQSEPLREAILQAQLLEVKNLHPEMSTSREVACSEIASTSNAGVCFSIDARLEAQEGDSAQNTSGWNRYSQCRNCGSWSQIKSDF